MAGPVETGTRRGRGDGPAADERRAFQSDLIEATPIHPVPATREPRDTDTVPEADEALSPQQQVRPAKGRLSQGLRQALDRTVWRRRLVQALEDEAAFGTPFLMVPVLLVVGGALYFSLPTEPAPHNVPAGLVLVAALCWWMQRRSRLLARTALAVLLVIAGMGLGQWQTAARGTQMLGAEVTTRLTGRIVTIEARPNGSVRYTLDVLKTERPRLYFAPDRLRVTARSPAADVRVGDGLRGLARLRPASGPARPSGYDFAFHGYFAGLGANGFFYGPPDRVAVPSPDIRGRLAAALQNARLWLGARIRQSAPGEAGTVAAALVNGDKSPISEAINESLRISGLAHILTISGLHMALVAGTVMVAFRASLALSGPLASGRAIKKHAAVAAFGAILVYLFLAGAGVATQRSFTMLAVMLCALMLDRRAISKRNLAIAAIVIILLSPSSVIGPSFHMSFAATLALIALYDLWNRRRAERFKRQGWRQRPTGAAAFGVGTWRFFAALAATSIVAGAASGLYAAYHFQRVAVLGLVTNLAAMPIVSLVTMPLAVIATLAIPFGIDGPLYALMATSAGWILAIADWVAVRSPDGMVGAMSNRAMLAATAALVWFCICRTRLRWGALIPATLATVLLTSPRDLPLAVVSEDGRQFALIDPSGALAVNRSRPNNFILTQWQRAYAAREVIKPRTGGNPLALDAARSEQPISTKAGADAPMQCNEAICTAVVDRGGQSFRLAILSAAGDKTGADIPANESSLCANFDLIILAYAPATSPCANDVLVLTAQDLALKGSAEIRANPAWASQPLTSNAASAPRLIAQHAVSTPFRPWHEHRCWSRAARNLESRR